jgi:hypothetical protein
MFEKLTMKDYYIIANEVGIDEQLYAEFMLKQFPNEMDRSYAKEWAERFKSGNPTAWMDKESTETFLNVVKKLKGII